MGTEDTKVMTLFSCEFVNLVISYERKKQGKYPHAEAGKV